MITEKDIENWFTHHPSRDVDVNHFMAMRNFAKNMALAILNHTPPGRDQTVAVRKLRECLMYANAAIACDRTDFLNHPPGRMD